MSFDELAQHPFLIAIILIIGLFNCIWPRAAWELTRGWEFKDAEPSELALGLGRAGGVLVAIIGLFLLF